MPAIKVGLVGCGTVGGGCADLIAAHGSDFATQLGLEIELARVCCLERAEAQTHGCGDIYTSDYHDVISDPQIDIVVELIGGTGIARSVIFEAIEAGKTIVTANKVLMASAGTEIEAAVRSAGGGAGTELYFGASVGGGIPIIGPLKHSLTANRISSVSGILNGTTNYILTRMAQDDLEFSEALAEAQAKGYAEADPTADIEGADAAAKIAILASLAFHRPVSIGDVYTQGISAITPEDLAQAASLGYAVKLLAMAKLGEQGIEVHVYPAMIPDSHQLAFVSGVYNAIYVSGDFVGDTMFYGQGAGAGAAASAVMADVLEAASHIHAGYVDSRVLDGNMAEAPADPKHEVPILGMDKLSKKYYVRIPVAGDVATVDAIADVFARCNVPINEQRIPFGGSQKGSAADSADECQVVFITGIAQESDMSSAIREIGAQLDLDPASLCLLRIETLDS